MRSCTLSRRLPSLLTEVTGWGQDTQHSVLAVPHLPEFLSLPGRFPPGAAPGADGAGTEEEEEDPGRAPGPAAGAVGAPGDAAGAGRGQSRRQRHTRMVPAPPPRRDTAPEGTAVTSGGIQRVPESSWHHPAPRQSSGEGDWCQRSREWEVIPNIPRQQPGIKSLFPPQSSWMPPYSHPEGLEMGESTHRAVGRDPSPIPYPCPSLCTSFQAVATSQCFLQGKLRAGTHGGSQEGSESDSGNIL